MELEEIQNASWKEKEVIFIDGPEGQWTVHWLGIPYIVESSYRGRFYNVLDVEEENISFEIEGKVLHKFFKMIKPKSISTMPGTGAIQELNQH